MTKSDITKIMANDVGLTPQQADRFVSLFIKTMVNALDNGETIYLRGLGTFKKTIVTKDCNVGIQQGNIQRKPFTFAKIRFKMGVSLKKKLNTEI